MSSPLYQEQLAQAQTRQITNSKISNGTHIKRMRKTRRNTEGPTRPKANRTDKVSLQKILLEKQDNFTTTAVIAIRN